MVWKLFLMNIHKTARVSLCDFTEKRTIKMIGEQTALLSVAGEDISDVN